MTMDFIGTLHALLTNYIESQINFHHLLVLTFLIVAIITLFIDVMRSDIDCRSTEEDELPVMKNDSKKAFCQTVRFTMRLRKQMKKFKERKTKMQTLQEETHK